MKITGIMKREQEAILESDFASFWTEGRMGATETSVMERKWKELLIFAPSWET